MFFLFWKLRRFYITNIISTNILTYIITTESSLEPKPNQPVQRLFPVIHHTIIAIHKNVRINLVANSFKNINRIVGLSGTSLHSWKSFNVANISTLFSSASLHLSHFTTRLVSFSPALTQCASTSGTRSWQLLNTPQPSSVIDRGTLQRLRLGHHWKAVSEKRSDLLALKTARVLMARRWSTRCVTLCLPHRESPISSKSSAALPSQVKCSLRMPTSQSRLQLVGYLLQAAVCSSRTQTRWWCERRMGWWQLSTFHSASRPSQGWFEFRQPRWLLYYQLNRWGPRRAAHANLHRILPSLRPGSSRASIGSPTGT